MTGHSLERADILVPTVPPTRLLRIPAGSGWVGCPVPTFEGGETRFLASHSSAFWLGESTVTVEQWNAAGLHPFAEGAPAQPVVNVSWHDAVSFCRAFQERWADYLPRECVVTLPTELQWEYAARAGTAEAYYAGDDHAVLDGIAWYSANSGGVRHAVCHKHPNPWGLYDMVGNVWQWCLDAAEPYPRTPSPDWIGRRDETLRAFRGCSYAALPGVSTLPCVRGWLPPEERLDDGGFRVCVSAQSVLTIRQPG